MTDRRPLSVTVAVIAYNGRPYLDECLRSVIDQRRKADEIIVVDNASSDDSATFVAGTFAGLRIIKLAANRGYSGGCNVAARIATSDCVVFLNQDVRVDVAWLDQLIEPLEAEPEVVGAQSLVLLYDEPHLVNTASTTVNFLGIGWCGDYRRSAHAFVAQDIAFMSGAAFAMRRSAFLDLGGFDETYGSYHEDVDLSWRIQLMGWRTVLAPGSLVFHKYRFVSGGLKNFWLERNRLMTLLKNYRIATLITIFPALVTTEIGICVLALTEGWLGHKLAGYRDLVRLAPTIVRRRREIQHVRRVPDHRIADQLVGSLDFAETHGTLVRLGSVILSAYWALVRRLIAW